MARHTIVKVMHEVYAGGYPLLLCTGIGAPAAVCDVNDLQTLKGYEVVPVSALVDAVCIWAPVPQELAASEDQSPPLFWISLCQAKCS